MPITRLIAGLAATTLTVATLTGCSHSEHSDFSTDKSSSPPFRQGCIKNFDSSKDYFPDKTTFSDARDITVSYHRSYKVVTLKHPSNAATEPVQYVLVQCGAPDPHLDGDLARAQHITIPTTRVALGSSTLPMQFQMLGKLDAVAGIVNIDRVGNPNIRRALTDHKVASFAAGDNTTEINTEKLAALHPDLFIFNLVSGSDNTSKVDKIKEMGIPSFL